MAAAGFFGVLSVSGSFLLQSSRLISVLPQMDHFAFVRADEAGMILEVTHTKPGLFWLSPKDHMSCTTEYSFYWIR